MLSGLIRDDLGMISAFEIISHDNFRKPSHLATSVQRVTTEAWSRKRMRDSWARVGPVPRRAIVVKGKKMPVRVLLMSSDLPVIETLCRFTDQMAMQVELCSDVDSATRRLCHSKYEAVMVDFKKTAPSLEFVKKLRGMTANRGAIVLAILDSTHEVPSAFRAGASFVLVRPLPSTIMVRTLKAAYPLMVLEKRRHFRCPLQIQVSIGSDPRTEFVATSINISGGGMALATTFPLRVGHRVELRLTLPGTLAAEKLRGNVVWSNNAGRVGIEFHLPQPVRERLETWLADRLDEPLPKKFFWNCKKRFNETEEAAGLSKLLIGLALLLSTACSAQQSDLADQSLEDLMNIKVTSVSRTEQTLSRTASAIFVITAEDIRRSGATNIPDLLRMVPGMDVAQIDANSWAISARGLNGRFSNELLVLVDGRNVYTPTFGGVYWDVLDMPLEDIERIEVIRGPGGTIWGANAVNGVINIITRKTSETHGGMVVAGGGNLEQGLGTVQYGGGLGKSTDYRVFTRYFNQDHMPGLTGQPGGDGWHLLRGGFRTDSRLSAKDTLMFQGDMYTGEEGNPSTFLPSVRSPGVQDIDRIVPLSGGFLQSAWNHAFSARSDTTLQISFDRYTRNDQLRAERRTLDVDFQHHFSWGTRQDLVWGANYRNTDSDTDGSLGFSLNPPRVSMQLFGMFIQDEIALVPHKLYMTGGIRLDHNYYTGFNILPSARVAWTPSTRHMFWAAISQANRTPAENDTANRINFGGFTGAGGVPTLVALLGNPHFDDEVLTAYEMGYRTSILDRISIDFAAYYSDYSHQETTEPATPFFETSPAPPHLVLPLTYENLMHGEAHGFEMAVNWKVTDRWTLSPGYAFELIHMHLDSGSRDTSSVFTDEGSSPVHSAQLRSHFELTHGIAWDASAYFVDRLRSGEIPSYTRVDTGLTWRWTEHLASSVVGQNLVKDRHLEFVDDTGSVISTLMKRRAYIKLTWQF